MNRISPYKNSDGVIISLLDIVFNLLLYPI